MKRFLLLPIVVVSVLACGDWLGAFRLNHEAASSISRGPSQVGPSQVLRGISRLPPPPRSRFQAPRLVLLRRAESAARWAPVLHPTLARTAPDHLARPVARLATLTPEGTTNIVQVLADHRSGDDLWVKVRLPILPNDSTGWIERSTIGGYTVVSTALDVNLRTLRLTLRRAGKVVFQAPVGVGAASSPTPRGHFYIRDRLHGFRDPFYGPVAFGTSARSAVLTEWPAGGFVGIHGTNEPALIPGRISHGCIRLRSEAILRLARLLPIGTPLTIH
jgi:L,D-transpeptidase-like protein